MKPIKVYQYANCSTCKKALRFLQNQKVEFVAVDIVTAPPSRAELEKMAKHLGDFRKLFNTSGQVYRELKLSEKMPGLDLSDAIELLAANGKLIKRPFVWLGDQGMVGFKEAEWKEALQ